MFVSYIRNTGLGFGCGATKMGGKYFIKLRTFTLSLILLLALGGQHASAFSWFDGVGQDDPCPTPTQCTKTHNKVADQDNGYHNMLQHMRGAAEPIINNYETAAETIGPSPTPAQYSTVAPVEYQGVFSTYTYGSAATTNFTAATAPVSPSPPTGQANPQLDPGIQGAMPRYNPDVNNDGTIDGNDKHIFMPPKNTPADSLVDMFPWLYMDTAPEVQHLIYRGIGGNTLSGVNNPMNLSVGNFEKASSNAEEINSPDNPAFVDRPRLNEFKCLELRFNGGQCRFAGIPVDLLTSTIGTWLPQGAYISQSPALLARLNMDSCTNQMIIPMGLNPNYVFNDVLRQHDAPFNESWCQPLHTRPVDCYRNRLTPTGNCLEDKGSRDGTLYDYRAWGYLRLAWKSVLQDAYTPSGGGGLYYGGQMGIGMPPYLTDSTFAMAAGIPALTLSFPGTLELVRDNPAGLPIPTDISGADQYGDPFVPFFPGGSVGPIGAMVSYIGSYTGARFTINDLARQRVERIWDPTHPYSPRWDFKGTDRLFSALARLSDPPVTGMGYTSSTSTCLVRCASVPVDILSFRLLAFSACMGCRIAMNAATFWTQVQYMMTDVSISILIASATCRGLSQDRAIENTLQNRVLGPLTSWFPAIPGVTHGRLSSNAGETIRVSTVFGSFTIPSSIAGGCHYYINPGMFTKSNDHNVDGTALPMSLIVQNPFGPQPRQYDSLWPTCNTKYEYRDQLFNAAKCSMCTMISGDMNMFNGVRNCCDDVAHALAPINTLKIRNTIFNPGLLPTPEGYTFKEYWSFRDDTRVSPYTPASNGAVLQVPDLNNPSSSTQIDYISSHMPYMRWWDTGTAAGGASSWVGIQDYNPDLDCGRYDTIVGVGTEDWEGDETKYPLTSTPSHTTATHSGAYPSAPSYDSTPDHPLYAKDWGHNNAAKYCRYGGNGFATDVNTGVPLTGEAITNIASAFGVTTTGIQSIENFLGISLSEIGVPPFYKCIRLRTIDIAHRKLGGDAMTSWLELKLYQARAIQRGLNCLPQYEKFHKPFGSEEFTLNALGASYNAPILLNRSSVDNTEALDPTKGPEKGYYRVPYRGSTSDNIPKLPNMSGAPHTVYPSTGSMGDAYETQNVAWPLAWRGYLSETDCKLAFPNFSGDGSTLGASTSFPGVFGSSFTLTAPCGTTLTSWAVSGWTIPGIASPLGNVPGPPFPGPGPAPLSYPELWPILPAGLDRAKIGDIVYLTHEDMTYSLSITYINQMLGALSGSATFAGAYTGSLPYAAVVVGTRTSWIANDGSTKEPVDTVADCTALPLEKNCFTKCEASVTLTEVNNGKFPDVCGNTDMYGYGQNRIIYKEWLPKKVMDAVFPTSTVVQDTCGNTYTTTDPGYRNLFIADTVADGVVLRGKFNTNYGSCADTKMAHCTYADIGLGTVNTNSVNLWNHFRVYRPLWDMRE